MTLTVKEAHVAERTWVTIAVQNTGVPIPSEELPRVFERFHRGSAAEIGQLPGTGVGLSIAEAIVRAWRLHHARERGRHNNAGGVVADHITGEQLTFGRNEVYSCVDRYA